MIKHFLSKIEIHPVLWVVIGAGLITGYFWEVLMVFFIVLIHECGHAVAAYYFKWRIHKIKLLPFGGVAEVEEYGNRPFKEELIVLLGGPIQHLWLPIFSMMLLHFNFWTMEDHATFLERNRMILFFNLLPILPLDGGKLLRLLMTKWFPYKKAHLTSLLLSLIFFLSFSMMALIMMPWSPDFWVIMIFIASSHYKEWKHHQYVFMRFLLERWDFSKEKKGRTKPIFVTADMSVNDVLSLFYKGVLHRVIIKTNESRIYIEETALLDHFFNGNGGKHAIGDFFG